MGWRTLATQCLSAFRQWSWTKENPRSHFDFPSLHHWRLTKQVFQFKQNMPHHSILSKIIQGSPGAQNIYFRVRRWSIYRLRLYLQNSATASEYQAPVKNEIVNAFSNILALSPFLDEGGLMRVGGRLKNSNLAFNACQFSWHILTQHIIERNLRAGLQATMAFVPQRFWPLSLRSTIHGIIQKCFTCFRTKSNQSEALMGSLSASRVNVSRPFSRCGVDYAGPLLLYEGKRRNAWSHITYVWLFVCFATKAVHLELLSDLTSEAFIAAFKRFISRRDRPAHMYSDNGTTFVSVHRQIQELYDI